MMTGFLSVAKTIGFISEMNYAILQRELQAVSESLDKNISNTPIPFPASGKGFNLPENFFLTENLSDNEFPKQFPYKGHLKDNTNVLKNVSYNTAYTTKSRFQSIGQNSQTDRFPKIKIDRKKIIIETVKQKENVMIKDVIPLFTDCSEKTIQRELSDLVSQGILKKTGDKRWSKYSLSRPQ
jgi:predicted transcriptional regulator